MEVYLGYEVLQVSCCKCSVTGLSSIIVINVVNSSYYIL